MRIVIIGATRGLGLKLTEKLLEYGYKVAAGATNISSELKELQKIHNDQFMIFRADVTDEELIAEGAKKCKDFLGEIDVVCNVAGVLLDGDRINPLHKCDIMELRKTLDVNIVGPVIVTKSFYPYLKDGSRVFIVTSEGVGIGNCGAWLPCYAISKAGATKVSGILNASVKNIDFYAVHPGRMDTDMGRSTAQISPEESAEGFIRLFSGETPISRNSWYINYKGEKMEY